MNKNSLNHAFIYAFFRYSEIVFLGLSQFVLAHKVGPVELGKLAPFLLYYLYSNYFTLGSNLVFMKCYSGKVSYIKSGLFSYVSTATLLGLLMSLLVSVLLDYNLYVIFLIFFISILCNFGTAFLRVNELNKRLNYSSFSYSLTLVFIVYFFVTNSDDYLFAFLFCKSIQLIFIWRIDEFKIYFKNVKFFLHYQKMGVAMLSSSIMFTLCLTFDRWVVIHTYSDSSIVGSYQLIETIGYSVFTALSVFAVFYYHQLLHFIKEDIFFRSRYLKFVCFIFFLSPIVAFLISWLAGEVVDLFYNKYSYSFSLIYSVILLKFLFFPVSLVSIYCQAIGHNYRFAFVSIGSLVVSFLFFILIGYNGGIQRFPFIYSGVIFFFFLLFNVKELVSKSKGLI
ncbi:hypothetical protein ACN0IJ_10605 [Shewanella indica]|uniref:hypothetical protein n=1 Tax=Shewanella indica TaxID=768528 RepID=UPI003D36F5F9